MEKALENLRVVDFTWVLAGPYATRVLADFGAEVIKIQSQVTTGEEDPNTTGYFNTWNRNKLGISLNLNHVEGVNIARRLIEISDVVVENFSPRVMRNWGLDYDSLRQIKPDLIMVSMGGMGQTGPWRDYVAFGPTLQAFSGITYLTAFPGQPPVGLGYSYADHVAGLLAALAILEAQEYRRKTHHGQYIDLSQLEVMGTLLGTALLEFTVNHREATPAGNRPAYQAASPHGVYRCKGEDRWCALGIFDDEQWQAFCQELGNPLWTREERFANQSGRQENADELDRLVEAWTLKHTAEEVMTQLQKAGIAAGVVQDASDLAKDPQLRARGFWAEADHPLLGKTAFDGSPIKLSQTPAQFHRAAPLFGQDNEYVYRELLGMSEEEISEYTARGIIR